MFHIGNAMFHIESYMFPLWFEAILAPSQRDCIQQGSALFFAMVLCISQAVAAVSVLLTFSVGVLAGWLAAQHSLAPARRGDTTSQNEMPDTTSQTTMPEASRQTTLPQARQPRGLHRGREYQIKKMADSPSCRHTGLGLSASNQWAWAVRCPGCSLKLSIWWKNSQDKSLSETELLSIAKEIVLQIAN